MTDQKKVPGKRHPYSIVCITYIQHTYSCSTRKKQHMENAIYKTFSAN